MESFHHWLLIMIKVNVGKKFWHWKKKPKTCSKRSLNLRLFSNLQMRINLPWRKYLFFHQRLAILLKSYCVLRQFLGQFRFSPLLYVSLDECVLLRTKNKSERRFVWRSTWLNSYWLYQFTCICEWILQLTNNKKSLPCPWRKYLFFHQRLAILLKSYCVLRQFLGQFRFSPLLYVSLDECVLLRTKNKSERRFVWRSTWLNSYWLYQFTCICEWIWICVYPGNGFWWGKSCWCYHWMRGVFLRTDHPCKRQGKWKNPR